MPCGYALRALEAQRWIAASLPILEQGVMAGARHLLPQGRLRVWSLEIDGRIVASEVFLAARGHVSASASGSTERVSGVSLARTHPQSARGWFRAGG